MEISEAIKIIADKRSQNKKIGYTCSSFDLLHAGHYLMLEDSKNQCDFLVVGLQTDPTLDKDYRVETGGKNKNVPVQSYEERLIQIKGCKYVDLIVKYSTETELLEHLKTINPDIRMLGADWENKPFTGHKLDIKVHFNPRGHNYSTSNLRKRVYEAENERLYPSN